MPKLKTLMMGAVCVVAACDGVDVLGPEPATCAAAWQTVFTPTAEPHLLPYDLLWHRQRLYYMRGGENTPLMIIPEAGEVATPAPEVPWAQRIWVDDEGLKFIVVGPRLGDRIDRYELRTASLEGASAQTVTPFAFSASNGFISGGFALTPDAIFGGTTTATNEYKISRFDRQTGQEQILGAAGMGIDLFLGEVSVWNNWLFFASSGTSFSFPQAGGTGVPMPSFAGSVSGPVGVSTLTGQVLWSGSTFKDDKIHYTLGVAQIGSGEAPKEMSTNLPNKFVAFTGWDDGHAGWFVAGLEPLADKQDHASLWHLDAAGKAKRLACDPEVGRYVSHGAVSPTGVFVTASHLKGDYQTQIAFVRRP